MKTTLLLIAGASVLSGQIITTVAGTNWAFPPTPLAAKNAPLGNVGGVAVDAKGNVYIADLENSLVEKVTPGGVLTVVAGNGLAGYSGDGGPATSAELAYPQAVALDSLGNLYIADTGNSSVRKVAIDGTISTIGSGLGIPLAVAVDNPGNVYVADFTGEVLKVSPGGTTTVFVGNPTPCFAACIGSPVGLAVDSNGNLYVAARPPFPISGVSPLLFMVTPAGVLTTIVSDQTANIDPRGVTVDASGNLYVANGGYNNILKITPAGVIGTIAGSGTAGFAGDGSPAISAQFNYPTGVALDASGNFYVADNMNSRIRKFTQGGAISTLAGDGEYRFSGDNGPAIAASLQPAYTATDALGNLYIGELNRVRKISEGIIATLAGTGTPDYSGDGGPAASATLNYVSGVSADAAGNVYIADQGNSVIRKVTPGGIISTVAGNGPNGGSKLVNGGQATSGALGDVAGIAADNLGNFYFLSNFVVWKVNSAGIASIVAGNGQMAVPSPSPGDGGPATAAGLANPLGIAVDAEGNLFIADTSNYRVRKVSPQGVITTVAGNGTPGNSGDGGPATSAAIDYPGSLAVDSAGNLYFSDVFGNAIRKVSNGIITTFAGSSANSGLSGDGGPAQSALLNQPIGVAADSAGNLYIADYSNYRVREVLAVPPSYTATPTSLTFSGTSGGAATAAQTVQLLGPVPGLGFSAETAVPWLTITPSSGVVPAAFEVSADPSQLSASNYTSTITITVPNANPPIQNIPVTFNVAAALPSQLSFNTTSLSFALTSGGTQASQQFQVTNQGTGSISFTAAATTASGGNWLQVSPQNGKASSGSPASLIVTANPGTLTPDTYSGTITISDSGTGGQITLPITMAISGAQQKILLSQVGLTFTAVAQGGAVLPQSIGILNAGAGPMNWTAAASTLTGSGWLTVSPASGTVAEALLDVSFVNVSVNAQSLAAGNYYGSIQIGAPGADNSPQTVLIVLNVLPLGSNPGPAVQPSGLVFTGIAGGENPGSQNVSVSNVAGIDQLTYGSSATYVEGNNWLSYQPTNATLAPATPQNVVVQPDFTQLAPGIYRGAITLALSDGSIRNVAVLSVVAPGPAGASPQGLTPAFPRASGCTPNNNFQIQPLNLPQPFTAILSQPTAIEMRVLDSCGNAVTAQGGSAAVQVTFSDGDRALNLVHTQSGQWNGTWTPQNGSPGTTVQLLVTFLTLGSGQTLEGTQSKLTATLTAGSGSPSAQSVLNAASLQNTAVLAPGALISIFGTGLASMPAESAAPFPPTLNGTEVTLAGQALPLLYASNGQINAQVPYALTLNTQLQLQVTLSGVPGVPQSLTVAPAQPAIFTKSETGMGQGAIVNLSYVVVDANAPASPGDTVVIFCTGLGAVSPAVAPGVLAPSTPPLAQTVSTVTMTIGGLPAVVSFAGLAPGFAGLYQINATVPVGVTTGNNVPVVIQVAGQTSPPATMAVQ
jgi:uncharacterized protein (TIGR03437 family)